MADQKYSRARHRELMQAVAAESAKRKPRAKKPWVEGKHKHDSWMLTINTNLAIPNPNDPKQHKIIVSFAKYIRDMLDQPDILFELRPNAVGAGHSFENPKLFDEPYTCQETFERGEAQQRLHAHILIKMSHWSEIQLDLEKINAYCTAWRGVRCKIKAEHAPQHDKYLEDYVRKDATRLDV